MERIKVAYIGDSPYIFSGFGVVSKAILSRLDPEVFDVSVLGTMFQLLPKELDGIPALGYYHPVCIHDLMGFKASIDYIQHVDPDVLFFIGDPGTLRNRYSVLTGAGFVATVPAVSYFPLEGAPFNPHVVEQTKMVHGPVTYTKWGADYLLNLDPAAEADWVWHGTDHFPGQQYSDDVRKRLRQLIGWDDRFVVGLIGMNKRTNRQPVMVEVAKMLKESGRDDVMIYMHCQEKGEIMMGGWELDWLIDAYGVRDQVQLKPVQAEHKYIARPRAGTLEEVLELPLPGDKEEAVRNLGMLDFVSLLNCFDLYLDPASAHGFNLPAVEAAVCGVPVATVDDGFARTEIYGECAYMMRPSAADYWHTGAILPLVSPKMINDTIVKIWDDGDLRLTTGEKCKEFFEKVKWQGAADLFAEKIKAAHEFGREVFGK